VLRAAALGLIAWLALAHLLGPAGYVALLSVSSLLSAWGMAGKYTLIAALLPAEQRVAGNSVFGLADQLSLMIGPALAGILTAVTGPAVVIGVDAVSWAVLAVSYARIAPLAGRLSSARAAVPDPAEPDPAEPDPVQPGPAQPGPAQPDPAQPGPAQPDPPAAAPLPSGWSVIRSSPVLPGLLALSFVFYLLYGPVEVALPVHVANDLHGPAALLGTFWAVFGVGAVIGELAAPYLRRWPVWPVMTGIVLGWGLVLVPLGLDTPLWAALAAFFAGAVIWGPWFSLSMAVLQDASPPDALAQVIAARGSLLILAAPLGTALGGPIVAVLGARGTLLASALATVALGVITAAFLAARQHRLPRRE